MSTPQTPTAPVTDTARPDTLVENEADEEASRPHDGDHNQGGARPAGIDYQRELGTEQDA
jgi:hypothetical protein